MLNKKRPLFIQLGNFLLMAIVFITCVTIAEFSIRFLERAKSKPSNQPSSWTRVPEESWIEYDSVLGWLSKKNTQAFLPMQKTIIPISINSQGVRGKKEYVDPKSPGIFRIYALGDSFTFGFGVRDEETFSAQLESMSPKLEVLNMGVPGYGIDQISLSMRERGYAGAPDFVLISIYPEDFWRSTRAYTDAGHGKPFYTLDAKNHLKLQHVPVPRDKNFKSKQFPEIMIRQGWHRIIYSSALYRLTLKAWTRIKKLSGSEDPDSSVEWVLGRAILKDLIREIYAAKSRPLLMLVPPERWISGTSEPVRDSLIRFAAREQVDILDLTPVFSQASSKGSLSDYYIPDDRHWTAKGHQLAAQEIFLYLQKHQLITASTVANA